MTELTAAVHDSVDDVDRNQWNNVVKQSTLGSVFHRYEWLQAVERGLGRGQRHVVVNKHENPVAIMPNTETPVTSFDDTTITDLVRFDRFPDLDPSDRLPVSVPMANLSIPVPGNGDIPFRGLTSTAPGFGGPVILTDEHECLDLLFRALDDNRGRSVRYHSIRAKEPGFVRYGKALAKRGYEPTLLNCRFELDLGHAFEDLLDRMDKERRKALRNARAREHRVFEMDLAGELRSTHDRYRTDMERVGGDVYPLAFFEELADAMADRVKLFGVEVEGTHAGRYLYLLDDEQSTVHYYFSAIGDAANFEYNPTELLHAHAIQWGQDNGYRYYDFGATGSTFLDGTFRYKEKYGGRIVPTLTWAKGYSPLLWRVYKLGRRRYQKMVYGRE